MTPRTPWSRAVTALGALAVTTLTTNCAGQSTASPTMADERRTDTVTVPVSTWTPTPVDVLADMPPAAAQRTPAGAEAYVRYYFDTLNHLSMNPQTGQITKLCLPQVLGCMNPELIFEGHVKHGSHMDTAIFEVQFAKSTPIAPNDAGSMSTRAQVQSRPHVALFSDMRTQTAYSSNRTYQLIFTMKWDDGRWWITDRSELD